MILKYRRLKLYPYLTPYTKIDSKWIRGLKIKNIKLLEEYIRANLYALEFDKGLLHMTQQAQATKENKILDFLKIKNSWCWCFKGYHQEWVKIFVTHMSGNGFASRIYKDLFQFNNKKTTQLKSRQRICIEISPKNLVRWPRSTWKDGQHWENANENHNELPLHTHQDIYNKKDR